MYSKRFLTLTLMTGISSLALMVSGSLASAATEEVPAPATVQGSDAVPLDADKASAPAAEADNPAANGNSKTDESEEAKEAEESKESKESEKADLVAMQAAGYKIVNKSGVRLYCKSEPILGSRLRTKTRCLTAAEMEQEQRAASDAIADISRQAPNFPRSN